MRDVLSVITFVMVALCFAGFLTTVKADAPVTAPSKPTRCKMATFWCAAMP
jgi:hypothetical protein